MKNRLVTGGSNRVSLWAARAVGVRGRGNPAQQAAAEPKEAAAPTQTDGVEISTPNTPKDTGKAPDPSTLLQTVGEAGMKVARIAGGVISSVALLARTATSPLVVPRESNLTDASGLLASLGEIGGATTTVMGGLFVAGALIPNPTTPLAVLAFGAMSLAPGLLHVAGAITKTDKLVKVKDEAHRATEGSKHAKARASLAAGYKQTVKDNYEIGGQIVDGIAYGIKSASNFLFAK